MKGFLKNNSSSKSIYHRHTGEQYIGTINEIRKKAKIEELDYLFLMECLSSFKQPRDKLTKLLKTKHLIRIKKGLYVFGKDW